MREKEVRDAESWPWRMAIEDGGAAEGAVFASVRALRSFRIAADWRWAVLKRTFYNIHISACDVGTSDSKRYEMRNGPLLLLLSYAWENRKDLDICLILASITRKPIQMNTAENVASINLHVSRKHVLSVDAKSV